MSDLSKAWDKIILTTISGKNHAFYGSLLCSLKHNWDEDIETAAVNADMQLKFNPDFFMGLSEDERKFILIHEVEHIARLHFIRMQERDPELWNKACDYEINQDLIHVDGMSQGNTNPLYDPAYLGKSAEQIYDLLEEDEKNNKQSPDDSWGSGGLDMKAGDGDNSDHPQHPTQEQINNMMNSVVKAVQASKMQGSSLDPSHPVHEILDSFLRPQVPWNKLLRKYLVEKLKKQLNWRKPKRRFEEVYLPSRRPSSHGLANITFYLDTSGSISDEMVQIFNSEVKHIFEHFKPGKMSLVQFDTSIREEITYTRGTRIQRMSVVGRGGTSLHCVHDHIMETKPSIAVVLTDLECAPMDIINGLEVMWVVFDNPNAEVLQGKVSHVNTRG